MAKSPQVILTEHSSGAYTVTTSDTILSVVGYATKGPINEVTSVTSKTEFIDKFGPISTVAPWSSLAIYRAFNQGNQVLFYRVEDGTATAAEVAILNTVKAAEAYQEFSATTDVATYTSKSIYDFNITVDTGGTQREVYITSPASGDWTLTDINSQINGQLGDTSGFVEFSNETPASITDGDYIININVDGAGAIDVTVSLVSTDTLDDIAAKIQAAVSGVTSLKNSSTGKLRIYSNSTGVSSSIAIGDASSGTDLKDIIGTVGITANGAASTGASSSINNETKKIRITSGNATVENSSVNITSGTTSGVLDLVNLLGVDSPVPYVSAIVEGSTDNILIKAIEKGSATNNISVVKSETTNPITNSTVHTISVYYEDVLKETFNDVSMVSTDKNFFVKVINADVVNGGSAYVNFEYELNDGDPVDFPAGTYKLGVGTDEYQDGDSIGDYDYKVGTDGIPADPTTTNSSAFVTALGTDSDLANAELYNYHILITPDNGSQIVQDTAIALAEYRGDFMYISDPPKSLTYSQVVDWHNGVGNLGRDNAINSKFSATYWSWLKDYMMTSDNTGEYIWCPPSVFIAEKWIEIDRKYGPWYAPAGDKRGKINAYDYEASPSLAQREILYGDFNAVNPIVFFNNKGLEAYGEKTLIRENIAENRIHVERMLIYVKKLIKQAMDGMIFEPNLPASWNKATNLINSILEPVRQANGIDQYKVIIDSTTTTASQMEQSIMAGKIEIVPVGSIEIVKLDITMYNPGATIQ